MSECCKSQGTLRDLPVYLFSFPAHKQILTGSCFAAAVNTAIITTTDICKGNYVMEIIK
jgi:hypothetical protein